MGKSDAIDCSKDVKRTQQSAKDECDINVIVERAKRGSDINHVNPRSPMYGDFTQLPTDLRDCLVEVRKAEEAFMTLDPVVRKRFHNDPVELMEFLGDPSNRDEGVALGIVAPPPEKPPVVEPVAPIADVSGPKKVKAKPVED